MFDTQVYLSTVKSVSIQLLHAIVHKAGLKQLCGNIGDTLPNADTNEKGYIRKVGVKFGEYSGSVIIIKKALYGLCSLSDIFHSHLANSICSFIFVPIRFNNNMWIKLDNVHGMYEYICTHVDDFMAVSKDPDRIMEKIENVYLSKDSSKEPPECYLGNDYKTDKKGQ